MNNWKKEFDRKFVHGIPNKDGGTVYELGTRNNLFKFIEQVLKSERQKWESEAKENLNDYFDAEIEHRKTILELNLSEIKTSTIEEIKDDVLNLLGGKE